MMGLGSILELVCDTCEKTFHINSSPKISGSAEINQRYSVNVGAVRGQTSTGRRQKRLYETLATLNVLWRTRVWRIGMGLLNINVHILPLS